MWLVMQLHKLDCLNGFAGYQWQPIQNISARDKETGKPLPVPDGLLVAFNDYQDALNWADGNIERLQEIEFDLEVRK